MQKYNRPKAKRKKKTHNRNSHIEDPDIEMVRIGL